MTLTVELGLSIGTTFDLDVSFHAQVGETLAILGPNGAGKSTVLRCIAGLARPDRGRVVLGDRTFDDTALGVHIDPQERGVGMVFQEHLLFPSMSVAENIAFGPRARGVPRREALAAADAWVQRVGLGGRGGDRPSTLSGGERQRVALARALAIDPRIVLLDEPLASLDATTRGEIRRDLRRHLDALTSCSRVLVTHDPVDAYALADRVVVLERGRVTQVGSLAAVTAEPRTAYLADLLGLNLLHGTGDGERVALADAPLTIAGTVTGPVLVAIEPRGVRVHPSDGGGDGWRVVVTDVDIERDRVRLRLAGPPDVTAEIGTSELFASGVRPGDEVMVTLAPGAARVYRRA